MEMPAAWSGVKEGVRTHMKPSYRCVVLVGMLPSAILAYTHVPDQCVRESACVSTCKRVCLCVHVFVCVCVQVCV